VEERSPMGSDLSGYYMLSSRNSRHGMADKDGVKQYSLNSYMPKPYRGTRRRSGSNATDRTTDAAALPDWYYWGILIIAIVSVVTLIVMAM